MIIDMENTTTDGVMMIYPDYVFSVMPEQSANIKETIVIVGTASNTSQSIIGIADQEET